MSTQNTRKNGKQPIVMQLRLGRRSTGKLIKLSLSSAAERDSGLSHNVDGFDAQLESLRQCIAVNRINPVPQIEALVKELVLGYESKIGRSVCTKLGTLLMIDNPVQPQNGGPGVYATLWWAFLCNVLGCSDSAWPDVGNKPHQDMDDTVTVASHSALALNHFNEPTERRKNTLWLTVLGTSGMLYSFARYPDPDDGPTAPPSQVYLTELISILRLALWTPVTEAFNPFVGELPVYNETTVRLYKINSLQYGIDALECISGSSLYSNNEQALRGIQGYLRVLKEAEVVIPQSQQPADQDVNYEEIKKLYVASRNQSCPPGIWLSSGVLRYALICNPDRDRAKFLSKFLPDIMFGAPDPDNQANSNLGELELAACADLEKFAEAGNAIATMAWMPFRYDSAVFRTAFAAANPNYAPQNAMCEALRSAGLLQPDHQLESKRTPLTEFLNANENRERPETQLEALSWCLYIKARLLERIYDLHDHNRPVPNALEWKVTLANHISTLFLRWNPNFGAMSTEDGRFTAALLVKLANDLLDQREHQAAQAPAQNVQHNTLINSALADLSRNFSQTVASITGNISNSNIGDVQTTRDRLARAFPQPRPQGGAVGHAAGGHMQIDMGT